MLRSVLYWVAKSAEYSLAGTEGGGVARIYCIGTPFVWWLAAAGPSLFAARLMTQVSAPLRAPTAPRRAIFLLLVVCLKFDLVSLSLYVVKIHFELA